MNISILIRLTALLGAVFILTAAVTSAFSVRISHRIKKPFTRIHHPFAIIGITLIIIHPLLVAWQLKSARILVPNFTSWSSFWSLAGCPALVLLALAILAALLMRRIPRFWRWGHWLIFPFMLMAGIHGLRTGQDLGNPFIFTFLGIGLFAALGVFFYKRLKKHALPKTVK